MHEHILSVADDPLSAALMKIKLRAFLHLALDAGGDWAIDFPGLDGFTLTVVQQGQAWVSMRGYGEAVRVSAGDCFLMTGASQFCLSSTPAPTERLPAAQLFSHMQDGVLTCQGGGDFYAVGILFRFEGHLPPILFARLPPVIHVAKDVAQAAVLRWGLTHFCAELGGAGVGRSLILSQLAPIMLLHTLRIYLSSAKEEANWLVALADPRLAKVLQAMQAQCERDWSLAAFANLAGMSRSGLALAFKKMVGMAPMDYLANWRMQVACELLRAGEQSLSAIAAAVGYGSDSAFSMAFTKIVACRPGVYRKRHATRQ
ncbi:MAG: AraC family transcriptional regulator [Pseudomonadota bacterium]